MQKKKILIVSMTSGFGHVRAGQALSDYAKENLPNVEVEHIDIANMNLLLKKMGTAFYEAASKKLPLLWGFLYYIMDFRFISFIIKKIGGMDYSSSHKIKNYIYDKNPDGIIFTNVVPLPLFNAGFRKHFANIKMGVVVTDYHGHPYYNFSWLDYYFVANTGVKNDLEKIGVNNKKIIVTGIPINPGFYIQENIKDLKLKYGIKNNLPVVLFMASFKISKSELVKTVRRLLEFEPKINVLFIANNNKKFYDLIKYNFSSNPNLLLVNWTNVIEEYMKISDVVISKAGGLTVSECLALEKPLIMVNPILGQEEHNAEFVEKNNFGKKVGTINEIFEILPKMMLSSKNNTESPVLKESSCEKIFKYF